MKGKKTSFLFLLIFLISCDSIEINYGITGYDYWAFLKNEIPVKSISFLDDLIMPNKERLDRTILDYWDNYKNAGKDTTHCILYFTEIMPFEWDTLIYIDNHVLYDIQKENKLYDIQKENKLYDIQKENKLYDYVKKYNISYGFEGLLMLNAGKIVFLVDLKMDSDNEKGTFFCTKKNIIERTRNDAKFHVQKEGCFFVVRDTAEGYVPNLIYVE